MTKKASKIISSVDQIKALLDWVYTCSVKGLPGGPVAVDIYRPEEKRNNQQNRLGWAIWTDISKQVEWYGKSMEPEAWKELLSHEWQAQEIVPAVSGGFCAIGVRTSKMRKRDFCELVEVSYAFGSQHGVRWSDPASAEYEEIAAYLKEKGDE